MSASTQQKEMTFLEHLEELRRVVIHSLIALAAILAGTWWLSDRALDFLITRTMPPDVPVVFLSVPAAFTARLGVAAALAVLVGLPYVAWRMWQFIVPGLLAHERRVLLPLSLASTGLFYLGVVFAFLLLVPIVVRIMLNFGTGNLVPTIAVGALLGFILKLCLSCGLVFQMPLVFAVLTHLGIVTPEWLVARWRMAVLIIFVVAALATPADAASQLVLGLPVTGLYFVSIALSRAVAARRRRRLAAEAAAEAAEEARDQGADGDDDRGAGGTGGPGGAGGGGNG